MKDKVARFEKEIFMYVWNQKTGDPVKEWDDVLDSLRYFHNEQFVSLKQPRHFFDTGYDRLISVQCTQFLSAESLNVFRPRSIAR